MKEPWSLYAPAQRWRLLALLFLVAVLNNFDRNVISVLLEPIKTEFKVSDTLLGLLSGFCFALFYAVAGIPIGRWADRGNRRTVISVSLVAWSTMTLCCGLAQTFWQLAIARVGVGIGEAGAIPAAQSLIVDYFPPERRASAIAILTSAATVGYLLGFGLGGYVAGTHGWRVVFLFAGAPGVVLAVLARCMLMEPRLQLGFGVSDPSPETLSESVARLRRKPGFRWALCGCLLYFFFAYGGLIFIPSFLTRVLHQPLAEVSVTYAFVAAAGGIIGTLSGGWLADLLCRRDIRWLAWLPAAAFALTGILFAAALWSDSIRPFMTLAFLAWIMISGGLPAVFGAIHAVCGGRRRATTIAIVLFAGTLFGGGLGPLATGALSDVLSVTFGAQGLRYSLMAVVSVLIPCASMFYAFGRLMPADLED